MGPVLRLVPPARTTCLLAESHDGIRSSLVDILEHEGFTIVGAAPTGAAALALVERHRPDVVIADFHLPDMTGIDVSREAELLWPPTAVLLHSRHETPRSIVPAALDAGVRGIVLKAVPATQLMLALETVLAGGVHVDPGLDGWDRRIVDRMRHLDQKPNASSVSTTPIRLDGS